MSDFVTKLYAKAFRYTDRAGALEIEDKQGNILSYMPFVVRAINDGYGEEYLNKTYVEELNNQRFDTEREAREYAINFLRDLRKKEQK